MTGFLLIFTTLCWGITPILEKYALRESDPWAGLTVRNITTAVLLTLVLLISGRLRSIGSLGGRTLLVFAITGVLAGFLGMIAYFLVLKSGETSRIVPIVAVYPLVTAFMSVVFLKEDVGFARIAGTVLIITGVWLVK